LGFGRLRSPLNQWGAMARPRRSRFAAQAGELGIVPTRTTSFRLQPEDDSGFGIRLGIRVGSCQVPLPAVPFFEPRAPSPEPGDHLVTTMLAEAAAANVPTTRLRAYTTTWYRPGGTSGATKLNPALEN
jgi:hypothetical protein